MMFSYRPDGNTCTANTNEIALIITAKEIIDFSISTARPANERLFV